MVTAETALALPAVVLVLGLLLGVAVTAIDQVRCVDAARAAARSAARGDPPSASRALAARGAPSGADIVIGSAGGGWVRATVRSPVPRLVAWVPGWPSPAASADTPVEESTR